MLKPYAPTVDSCEVPELDAELPARLAAEGKGFWLAIMRLDGLKKADPTRMGDIAELERGIRPGAHPLKPPSMDLPDAALFNWGRIERLDGKSWRGLRWIAQYAQDIGPLQNPLTYVFAALSNDGKYFIWLWADIEYLAEPPELFRLSGEQIKSLDDPKSSAAFQQRVDAALTRAHPESFKPNLNQLDAAVRSLELR